MRQDLPIEFAFATEPPSAVAEADLLNLLAEALADQAIEAARAEADASGGAAGRAEDRRRAVDAARRAGTPASLLTPAGP
ncbi:hypothetical protein L6R50_19725 [Myxococcota bacterium]|nr:hypothetical protein [Myxococcota bacterium]